MSPSDIKLKLRSHFHFIAKQRLHERYYNVRRIRAVLIEGTRTRRTDLLRKTACHPLISGNKPSPLFWFTTSELLCRPQEVTERGRTVVRPHYLVDPAVIFQRIWAPPQEDKLFSILD